MAALARLSVPRHKRTPASSSRRTGAMPTRRLRLLRGQIATNTPRRASSLAVRRRPPGRSARPPSPRAGAPSAVHVRDRAQARSLEGHVAQAPPVAGTPRQSPSPWRQEARLVGRLREVQRRGPAAARDPREQRRRHRVRRMRGDPHARAQRRLPRRAPSRRPRRPGWRRRAPGSQPMQLVEHDRAQARTPRAGRGARARSTRRPRRRCRSTPAGGSRAGSPRARTSASARPRCGHQRLDPGHEAGRRPCGRQPGQVRQLEVAVRVDEPGQQHARAQVVHVVRGVRPDRPAAPTHDDAMAFDGDASAGDRRPAHGHHPGRGIDRQRAEVTPPAPTGTTRPPGLRRVAHAHAQAVVAGRRRRSA